MSFGTMHNGLRKLTLYFLLALVVVFYSPETGSAVSHMSSSEGVVRAGSTCSEEIVECSIFVESSCHAPPVVLSASIDPLSGPATISVTDPDGITVQTNQVSDFSVTYVATKSGSYMISFRTANGDLATSFAVVGACSSRTQIEWTQKSAETDLNQMFSQPFSGIFVGDFFGRSVKIFDAPCVSRLLPLHGKIDTLSSSIGTINLEQLGCNDSVIREVRKISNALVGEQIAASLNAMRDPLFAGTRVCTTMSVRRTSPSRRVAINIPQSVITALTLRGDLSVNGLIDLADLALAGNLTDSTILEDIHQALAELNRAFGSGGVVVECSF